MFALVMSEDRISMQNRRLEVFKIIYIFFKCLKFAFPLQIIDGLQKLPKLIRNVLSKDQAVQTLAKELVNEVIHVKHNVAFFIIFHFF